MVDELLSAYPHQLTFSEAGMRIMITSHFSPRTRLTMASRMLIMEVRACPIRMHTVPHSHTHCLPLLVTVGYGEFSLNSNNDPILLFIM